MEKKDVEKKVDSTHWEQYNFWLQDIRATNKALRVIYARRATVQFPLPTLRTWAKQSSAILGQI